MLYELRGATRAECFFILHWGHETVLRCEVCTCVCARVRACLHTQQLVPRALSILRLLTPQLLLLALVWPPSLSTLLPPSEHAVVTPRSSPGSPLRHRCSCRLRVRPGGDTAPAGLARRKWSEVAPSHCCAVMP